MKDYLKMQQDFDLEYEATKRFIGCWSIFVALVIVAVLSGLGFVAYLLLAHFHIIG